MEPAGAVVVGGGAEVQRTNSSNLRELLRVDVERTSSAILLDFLRIKQEDSCRNNVCGDSGSAGAGGSSENSSRQTLGAVLSLTKNSISNERSLLDAIRDEPSGSSNGGSGSIRDSKKNWRDLKKRLKLRRGGAIPAPSVPLTPIGHRLSLSELLRRTASQALDRGSSRLYNSVGDGGEEAVNEGAGEASGGVGEPARMSLMALLAETDSAYIINGSELVEGEDEEEVGKLLEYNACCVCMVRHKGAAFIPCGHTFCRLCSRELYVQRGNCPICNNLIMEILDIF